MTPDTLLWSPQRHGSWPAWWRRQARQRRGRCGSGPYPLAAEDPGRFDQRQVGERLREVADLPAADDVVLLGVQAQVVTQGEQPLNQPERAGKELALAAGQAVVGGIGRVARDEAVVAEFAADRVDGARETVV